MTRSAWNSMPLSEKPRKMPAICSLSKSLIDTYSKRQLASRSATQPDGSEQASFIPPGGHVGREPQLVDDRCPFAADLLAYRLHQGFLDDVQVEIGHPGMPVGLLQAVRVKRDGEPGDGIREQVTEHRLRVGLLAFQQVDGPDRIARARAEPHEMHGADVVSRVLPVCLHVVRAPDVLVVAVDLLLHLVRHRYEAGRSPFEQA